MLNDWLYETNGLRQNIIKWQSQQIIEDWSMAAAFAIYWFTAINRSTAELSWLVHENKRFHEVLIPLNS